MCPGVDILTVLTQRIVSATVTPACNSTELAWLEEHQANITVGGHGEHQSWERTFAKFHSNRRRLLNWGSSFYERYRVSLNI